MNCNDKFSSLPDRRVAERRSGIETDDDERYARRMNVADRRISPAIGQHAILEAHRLREELLQCRSKLALAAESAAGDGELIAELLALVKLAYEFSKYSAAIHFTEPRKPTNEWMNGHRKLIEDLQPKLEAAIDKAQP